MQFIALFLPSFLGCSVYEKMNRNIDGIIRYIYIYFLLVMGTNIFTMFIITYVLGVDNVISEALKSFSFFMIYTVMACVVSIAEGFVAKIIKSNFAKWEHN